MVGRELQKIRPYGEDHQGLVLGIRGTRAVGEWTIGTRTGDSKR